MRTRVLCLATAVLASLATVSPATASAPRGGVLTTDPRTTTIRAACTGGASIEVEVDQPGDESAAVLATVSNVPLADLYSGQIQASSAAGGGGSSFGGQTPSPDGTVTAQSTIFGVPDPTVVVTVHSDDGVVQCMVRSRVERQFARADCAQLGRQIAVTALREGSHLAVSSRLSPVAKNSAWTARMSVRSPHASEGAAAATHATAAGAVRASFSFGYVANRSIKVAFANSHGKACSLLLGSRRTPPA
jgi:hypothetical protein